MLLDSSREDRAAQRRGCGQPADVGDRRLGDILQDHDAGAGRRVGGQERRQPGEARFDQRAQPGSCQRRGLEERRADRVKRQADVGGVEVPVVPDRLCCHVDQRILRGRVELTGHDQPGMAGRVDCGPVDLRQRPVPVGILDPQRGPGWPGQQAAHDRGHRLLARMGTRGVHGLRVRLGGCLDGEMREGRDDHRSLQELAQVAAGQRGFGDSRGVAGNEGQCVRGRQREMRRPGWPGHPVPLAEQAQCRHGQRGEIPGADRPPHRDRHRQATVDGVDERVEYAWIHARPAGRDLVDPYDEHPPAELSGYQRPAAAGMTAHEPQAVAGGVAAAHRRLTIRAHAGCPAVDLTAGGGVGGNLSSRPGTLPAVSAERDLNRAARYRCYVIASQRPSVENEHLLIHRNHSPGVSRRQSIHSATRGGGALPPACPDGLDHQNHGVQADGVLAVSPESGSPVAGLDQRLSVVRNC